MRLRHSCVAGIILLTLSLSAPAAFAQDNPCDIALQKAAYDELHVQNDKAFDLKVITAIKQTDWSRSTDNVSADGSVGIGIFSLGGDYEREQMQEMKKYYEQTGSRELRAHDRSFLKKRTASKTAYGAWQSCVETFITQTSTTPKPVDIKVATASEDGAIITISWNKNFAGGQPTLLRYDADRLTCPQPASKTKLTSEVISVHCHWADPYADIGIVSAVTAKSGAPFVKVRRPKRELDTTFQEFRRGEQFTDERKVCAATVRTPELHEVDCGDGGNACTGDGKHAMGTVRFELRPNAGYAIIRDLRSECDDNQGSCGWNGAGDFHRWNVTRNTREAVSAERLFGSRSIGVRLCATEGKVSPVLIADGNAVEADLAEGTPFVRQVRDGHIGRLLVTWPDSSQVSVTLPEQSEFVKCEGPKSEVGTFTCTAEKPRRPAILKK